MVTSDPVALIALIGGAIITIVVFASTLFLLAKRRKIEEDKSGKCMGSE